MESLTEQVQQNPAAASPRRAVPWMTITWFGLLLIGAFFPILRKLVNQWATDEDVGHGFFVPIVFGFIAWQRRDTLMSLEWKPCWWGVGLIVLSGIQAYIGMLGAELFLQRTAFLEALLGVLLVMGGTATVRALLFPLLLLPFMIPIPGVIYSQITFPLQLFASSVAETVLNGIGIPALRDGNILELASQKLSVVEACSGIRSLLTLTFLSLVYAYVFDGKMWMRWALLAITIPIAILANAGRVTITGILSEIDTKLANGIFHQMEGWVIFAIAFLMLVIAHQLINWIYGIRHEPKVLAESALGDA